MNNELDDVYLRKETYAKDHAVMKTELESLKSRLSDQKDIISWGIGLLALVLVITQIGVGFMLYLMMQ